MYRLSVVRLLLFGRAACRIDQTPIATLKKAKQFPKTNFDAPDDG
jgi:hypothetical protein